MGFGNSEIYFKPSGILSKSFVRLNAVIAGSILMAMLMIWMTSGKSFPFYWLGLLVIGALITINMIARFNSIRKGGQPIRFEQDHLILPNSSESASHRKIPYGNIYSFDVRGKEGREKLVIDTKHLTFIYPIKDFQEKRAFEIFNNNLYEKIEALPEGKKLWQQLIDKQRFASVLSGKKYPVTLILLVFLVSVYLIQILVGTEDNEFKLIELGANVPFLVEGGQWYRLVTANFLHANLMHLVTNGIVLFFLGFWLERLIGSSRFLLIFLFSGIIGALCSTLFISLLLSVGASASVFGLLGALAFINWRFRGKLPGGYRIHSHAWLIILGINAAQPILIPQIDIFAHLGGFIGGTSLAYLLYVNQRSLMEALSGSMLEKALTISLSGLFLFGSMQAVVHYLNLEKREADKIRISRTLLQSREENSAALNGVAWWLAIDRTTTNEILEMALGMATKAIEIERNRSNETPGFLDTLATIHYRLGHFNDAVEIQRDVLGQEEKVTFASQLARFLKALVEKGGPVVLGDVALSGISLQKPGYRHESIILDLSQPAVHGMDIYANAVDSDGRILGLLRLSIAPDKERKNYVVPIRPEVSKLLAESQELELMLIDGQDCRCPYNEWRFWPYDKSIAGLP
jgi:rhomboid protease GluP